jgi:hypothetical protein
MMRRLCMRGFGGVAGSPPSWSRRGGSGLGRKQVQQIAVMADRDRARRRGRASADRLIGNPASPDARASSQPAANEPARLARNPASRFPQQKCEMGAFPTARSLLDNVHQYNVNDKGTYPKLGAGINHPLARKSEWYDDRGRDGIPWRSCC